MGIIKFSNSIYPTTCHSSFHHMMKLKFEERKRIHEYCSFSKSAEFHSEKAPWEVPCDYAVPCATQNEIGKDHATKLVKNGCRGVFEGANMPSTSEAIQVFKDSHLTFGPAKAVNAGGVA